MMKKITALCALLIMFLLLSACGKEKTAGEKKGLDYLNAEAWELKELEPDEYTARMYYAPNKYVVIEADDYGAAAYLCNESTGEKRELKPREEDSELWAELARLVAPQDNDVENETAESGGYAACMSRVSFCTGCKKQIAGDHLLVQCRRGLHARFVIDTKTAVIRPLPKTVTAENGETITCTEFSLLKDGTLAAVSANTGVAAIIAPDGSVRIVDMSGERTILMFTDESIAAVRIADGGVCSLSLASYDAPDAFSGDILLGKLGYQPKMLECAGDKAVLCERPMSLMRKYTLLVDKKAGTADVLYWKGKTMRAIPVSEYAEPADALLIYVLGVSDDGRYIAFVSEGGLYMLDVESLAARLIYDGDGCWQLEGWNGSDLIWGYEEMRLQIAVQK